MPKSIRSPRHQKLIEALIEIRLANGLTQAALAQSLNRPQSFVAKIENGERRLDVVEFIDLVEAAGGQPQKIFAQIVRSGSFSSR